MPRLRKYERKKKMKLKEIFTEEELKNIINKEGILGYPNFEEIDYNLNKHYLELTIEQYIEIRKIDLLAKIDEAIENLNYE